MDSGIAGYDEGCIAVDGDVIAYIGREEQFQQDFAADRVIDERHAGVAGLYQCPYPFSHVDFSRLCQ